MPPLVRVFLEVFASRSLSVLFALSAPHIKFVLRSLSRLLRGASPLASASCPSCVFALTYLDPRLSPTRPVELRCFLTLPTVLALANVVTVLTLVLGFMLPLNGGEFAFEGDGERLMLLVLLMGAPEGSLYCSVGEGDPPLPAATGLDGTP